MKKKAKGAIIGAAVGTGMALIVIPAAIGALGFTAAGIAAGSLAAKMMSAAAIANGGGVAAGSLVAVLQSVGAAGLSLSSQIGLTSALGSLGAAIGATFSKDDPNSGDAPKSNQRDDPDGDDSDGDESGPNPPTDPPGSPLALRSC